MNETIANPANARDGHYAIVVGKFNQTVTEKLLSGARAEFHRQQVAKENVHCVRVPGAFEIPQTCRRLIATKKYAAVIALGAVIRGETAHFDFVAGECARGIAELNLHGDTPVIFGVLTTDTVAQAMERAAPDKKNKGAEAVIAAMEMTDLLRQL